MFFNELLSKIGISQNLAQDAVFILAIILLTVVFTFLIGRYRLISVLISAYISLAVLSVVPKEYLINYIYQLVFYFAFLFLLVIFNKGIFQSYISGSGFLWRVFLMSFFEVMFFLSIIFSIIPKNIATKYISGNAYDYLVSSELYFIWILAPLITVFLIRKRLG